MNTKIEHEQQLPLLNLKNVVKKVKTGSDELTILQGLDLEIKHGESLAIVGASGSGKSTLLGIMAGLDQATSGEVWLNGQALHSLDEDQRAAVRAEGVGFVFQNFQLLPALTALENVRLPLEMTQQYSLKECQALAQQWLDKVGLGHRMQHYPTQLSGGEQQRVAIARAFACQPSVLFADEPTGNLDRKTGKSIIDLLFEFNQQNQTSLVLVTHDEHLAQRCQRSIHIEDGMIVNDAVNERELGEIKDSLQGADA
ncbi:MAG: putative ABC transport system ATP-binding protein [Pseudohongiellaceae bacterium]|jgi:putative ABC transport system ATP-binding protein